MSSANMSLNESLNLNEDLETFWDPPIERAPSPLPLFSSPTPPQNEWHPEYFGPQDGEFLPLSDLQDGCSPTPATIGEHTELVALWNSDITPIRTSSLTTTPIRGKRELKRGSLSISRHLSPLTMPRPRGGRRSVSVRMHVNSPFRCTSAQQKLACAAVKSIDLTNISGENSSNQQNH